MPPLVGVAVKVYEPPTQAEVVVVEMLMAGVIVPTVIVIALEVAVVGEAQAEFDVITQVTICPLVSVVVVKVGLFVPALLPFTSH